VIKTKIVEWFVSNEQLTDASVYLRKQLYQDTYSLETTNIFDQEAEWSEATLDEIKAFKNILEEVISIIESEKI
jgi:hypothetical protein